MFLCAKSITCDAAERIFFVCAREGEGDVAIFRDVFGVRERERES